jgi:nucleoside-diphosphate-sugar epimerase
VTRQGAILVTGATGFLGGAVARALVARGDVVRALVRLPSKAAALADLGIRIVEGDVMDRASVARAAEGCSAVIHAAGKLGGAGARDEPYRLLHAGGTRNVLEATRGARVVHVSSPGILGPITGTAADEDAPLRPTNTYERAKAAAEREVHEFEADAGSSVVIVRPEFVYGPGDYHVLRLFRAIRRRRFFYIGAGAALCHPTYVDDAARGILAALDRGAPARTYHLAGPRPRTIQELATAFAAALGVPPPRVHVPERLVRLGLRVLGPFARALGRPLPIDKSGVDFFTMSRAFSWARAERELGWAPRVDVEDGAKRAVAWYEGKGLL